ncbi:MAG: hypothetical protein ACRC1M_03225 [Methanobacteriaceae archaeon]
MNLNKNTATGIFIILAALIMICSISTSFAHTNIGPNGIVINAEGDNASSEYAKISVNKDIFSINKNKIPLKYKKYENYTFQLPKGSKIKYTAIAAGPIIVSGAKVKNAYIDFGDGTKSRSAGGIAHTYKKAGWYKLTVSLNATFTNGSLLGTNRNGSVENAVREYLFYVSSKPQLVISGITPGCTNINDYKKGNINFLDIKVTNIGASSSKYTELKIWYEKPNKTGQVNPKLKKFTKSGAIKALKSGKSTTVRVFFSIPKKYAKLWKNIKLDSLNRVDQISKADNLIRLM